jgi:predicted RNA-binding protein
MTAGDRAITFSDPDIVNIAITVEPLSFDIIINPMLGLTTSYTLNSQYLSNVNPGTDGSTFTGNFSIPDNLTYRLKNAQGNEITGTAKVGTGSTVTFTDLKSGDSLTYSVVIIGDVTGDGVINAQDLLDLKKKILGLKDYSGAFIIAGNMNKDNQNKVDAMDILPLKKHLLGLLLITQS